MSRSSQGEPRQCVALGAERLIGDMPAPVMPVRRLPAAGRELADTAEMTTGQARNTDARSRTQRARRRQDMSSLSAVCPLSCSFMVETMGLEPTTPCVQSRCSRR